MEKSWPALDIQQADDDHDDLVQAFLVDFNLAAIDGSRFFFHAHHDRDRAAQALQSHFPRMIVNPIDVPDEDWAARSQMNLRSVRVGSIVISPPWDAHDGSIIIKPSMGFGTGHHATTRLCVDALQRVVVAGRTVIDVGTGSGVLAIAARRLGASGVLAIDDDADAIAAAEENVAANGETRIALDVGDFRSSTIGQFDVVIANLTGALLVSSAERIQSFAVDGGNLVLSGFMQHEADDVLAAFGGWEIEARATEDEWVCARLRRTPVRTPATS